MSGTMKKTWRQRSVSSSAYKKQDATELTLEEIKCVLLTTDGKGEKFKEQAL